MRKSKSAYMNFVCPYCWNTLNNCTCETFPPYHTIFIDKNIQEHIRILNEKGYYTTGCCEGHKNISDKTYISFSNNHIEKIDMPNGFKYDINNGTIYCIYPKKLTKKKMEEIKKEKLKTLLEWCKSLPNRNIGK